MGQWPQEMLDQLEGRGWAYVLGACVNPLETLMNTRKNTTTVTINRRGISLVIANRSLKMATSTMIGIADTAIAIGDTKNRHKSDVSDQSSKNADDTLNSSDGSRVSETEKR